MIRSMRVAILALIFFMAAATVAGMPIDQQLKSWENLEDCAGSSVDCAPEYEEYRKKAAKHVPRRRNPVVIERKVQNT